jgi:hypothetical protein
MNSTSDVHDTWIGVDLDGTLAHYDEFRGDDHVGKPVDAMVSRVKGWLKEGYDVRIFTARRPHPAIRRWCQEHLGKVLPVTNKKDSGMIALYDDRAVGVKRNEGVPFSVANELQVKL